MDLFPLARPLLHRLDPERAHDLTLWALGSGLGPRSPETDDPILATRVWGLDFPNPLGLSAGFDKNARVMGPILDLGLGFVEIGTVTPRPQAGNPKPRIFRLPEERGVINRLGFNNGGLPEAGANLKAWRSSRRSSRQAGLVGVNIGKNKETAEAAEDYRAAALALSPYADYLVINVSSPNTPGLRNLQGRAELETIVAAVRGAMAERKAGCPLLVKLAPDLAEADLAEIAGFALEGPVDGLIATNTTIARPPGLKGSHAGEAGGLSGRPLFELSTRVLARLYGLTEGRLPLIGVGGVGSGEEAYAKIRAGASLVQLYSALVYEGPALVGRIKRDLAELLRGDGFASVAEAVGSAEKGGGSL